MVRTQDKTFSYFKLLIKFSNPHRWTFLWINEGFAAMYQYQLPHKTYPEDRYMDNFFISYQRVAMELDANPAIRAMSHYVENPDRIEE